MNVLTENLPDAGGAPAAPSDPRLLELAAQVRSLQAELKRQEASAMENAKLFAQAHSRLRELSALNKVSRAIITTLDVGELLRVALQQTVQVTDADTGSVMLVEAGSKRLRIAAGHGLSAEVLNDTSVAVGDGVAGWVAKHRKPLLVPNLAHDSRFNLATPRDEIKSAMSAPILTKFDVLGVLNVARSSSNRPYTNQDLQLLTTLAGQVSLSVENARLFEAVNRRNEELSVLMDLSHQLTGTLNLREVLDIVADQACSILKADAAAVFLRDDRNDVLRVRATRHLSTQFHRKVRGKLGHGLIGDVAITGVPEYVPDVARASRLEYAELQAEEGMVSMLCAPLRTGGQSVGALAVYKRSEHHWEDHEINMLMALAGQGAMAVHNAENFQIQLGIAKLVEQNLAPQMHWSGTELEVGHRYLPAKQVGGDYYDMFDLPDGRIGILMADVAGKSVQAAVHTAKGKYFIHALGHESDSPSEVMRRTNGLIHADTTVENFISVFYAVLEPDRRTLRYCNAGHPPPLLLRADGSVEELSHSDILLGILPSPEFTEVSVSLEPGDTLVLTTDGVTEARGDAGMYGLEHLHACAARCWDMPAQDFADCIVEDVLGHSGQRMRDDIAVLVVRF
ncbi:MAG TPA: SpoIIE family protein phosphatase [Armatimonadota bacterium]|jgi:GAF domain-containing protein